MSFATHHECSRCGQRYPMDGYAGLCRCGASLLTGYNLEAAAKGLDRDAIAASGRSLWKYRDLLPVSDPERAVTLGEGGTPLLPLPSLGERLGIQRLFLKDEGINPTGTFKARGASVGVTVAMELGVRQLVMASSGNGGHAWATYSARAGRGIHLVVHQGAREINLKGCSVAGAHISMVEGPRSAVSRTVAEAVEHHGWTDASRGPYRIEAKKTIGYEIAEQLGWQVPDVVLYPTGGCVGPVGLWKGFRELAELGWTDGRMPRLVAVQSEGCYPVVKAFREGKPLEPWPNPHSIATGILTIAPVWGDFLIARLRETGGTGSVVTEGEILDAVKLLAAAEGVLACPEGAATLPAAAQLRRSGFIRSDDLVVLVNTGSGLKYPQILEEPRVHRLKPGEEMET